MSSDDHVVARSEPLAHHQRYEALDPIPLFAAPNLANVVVARAQALVRHGSATLSSISVRVVAAGERT